MLELNQSNSEEILIKDVNEDTFMDDVIEASKSSPIVVDFWAPWCGPCKTLGPALEAEVKATNGKIKMVKIDIDQNQNLASQMRIQSIPAVFAFVDGQPIDGFMGAKAPSELKVFIEKLLEKVTDDEGDLSEAIAVADEMLESEEFDDAAETFEAILGAHIPELVFFVFFLWSWCILTSQVEVFVFHQANKAGLYFTAVRQKLTRSREHKPPTHITTGTPRQKPGLGGYRPQQEHHKRQCR